MRILPRKSTLLLGLAITSLSSYVATATPYATCLTNSGGTISFRLNENATKVQVLWSGGSTNLGARNKGLTVTNLGPSVTSPFYVQVINAGNSTINTNNQMYFNAPRGVAVNLNPRSPNFGRIFVANCAAGGSPARGDGIYGLQSDFVNIFGSARTAGIDFVTADFNGTSSPWRLNIGEDDDQLYIADWTDASANLYVTDQNITSYQYALQPLGPCLDGTLNAATDGGSPVGNGNNHGSIAAVWVFGTTNQGNLTILTVDEDLQDNRTDTLPNQMNSVWRYNVGSGPFPFTNWINDPAPLTNRLLTPNIQFVSNVEGLSRGTNGYLYFSQGRANGYEPGVFVITNIDTAYQYGWNDPNVWNSYTASRAAGRSVDILLGAVSCTVSRDGRWLASINYQNNVINIVRLTNGIPDFGRMVTFSGKLGTTASGRDIAFDAADNLIYSSSGLGNVYYITLGLSATNTTGSDGTFVSAQPPLVSVVATTNLAHRVDVPGCFTFYRDGGDISTPLTVKYTISGAAKNGTDYSTLATSVTIPAGAASVNVPVVPLASSAPVGPLAVTVTLAADAAYNLVDGRAATVIIVDNSTPLLSITRNYVSMYERLNTDFIRFTINRLGETNSALSVNITNAGTAVLGGDYTGSTFVSLNPGVISQAVEYNPTFDNNTVEGPLSIVLGLAPATDGSYNITNSVATFTLIDSDLAPETVLWSENFDAYGDTLATNTYPAAWTGKFASYNNIADYSFTFGYNYALDGIPSAPGAATTYGLKATVNKFDTNALGAAALNFYPVGQSFSGNYALRFNMLLINGTTAGTEHAIFGINHSGSMTNWNRSGGVGNAAATNQDGVWFSAGAMGGNSWDYCAFTKATGTATSPVALTNRQSANTIQVFKNDDLATMNPPLNTGPYAVNGCPGCAYNGAKNWVDVEVAQTANMVLVRMNNQIILATTNITPFTSGNIMLGYNDMFDSIGDAANANVYYDNIRVVRISAPTIVTQPTPVTVAAGNPTSFSVVATTTTGVINYQWFYNNAAVANATNATLSFTSVGVTNYGSYYVVVDDGSYPIASAVVSLAAPAPVINVQPVSKVAVVGSSPSFNVVATTYTGVTNYQWRYYGTNLSGATSATLTLPNVQSRSFGGQYTVQVNDGVTSITSAPVTLTLALSPTITSPAKAGSTFSLSFSSQLGVNYVLDYKSNLTTAPWIPLSTNAGSGSAMSISTDASGDQGFYRLRLQ